MYISKKRIESLKVKQKEVIKDIEILGQYLEDPYFANNMNDAAVVAIRIQLNAEVIQQHFFGAEGFVTDTKVTDESMPSKLSRSLGVLQVPE